MKIEKMMLGLVCAFAVSGMTVMAEEGTMAAAPAADKSMAPAATEMAPAAKAPAAKLAVCAKCEAMVKAADVDTNGVLSAKEFTAMYGKCVEMTKSKDAAAAAKMPTAEAAWKSADLDGNGSVSMEEMAAFGNANCPDCRAATAAACTKCSGMSMEKAAAPAAEEKAAPAADMAK